MSMSEIPPYRFTSRRERALYRLGQVEGIARVFRIIGGDDGQAIAAYVMGCAEDVRQYIVDYDKERTHE